MGNDLGAPQPQAKKTFSSTEVKRLRTRFRKLDADDSGTLSVDEIMKLPNVSMKRAVHFTWKLTVELHIHMPDTSIADHRKPIGSPRSRRIRHQRRWRIRFPRVPQRLGASCQQSRQKTETCLRFQVWKESLIETVLAVVEDWRI